MAAAYAALVSLMHIIERLEHHPRPPISLDKQQVQSLTENVTFLQDFLEVYSHVADCCNEPDALEIRIADAAYAAEDVIESYIVDQIHAGSTSHGEKISSIEFYQGLHKVIEDMDSIKKEVMEIPKEKTAVQDQLQLQRISASTAGSLRSSTWQNIMVGFDDLSLEIMDKLTRGQPDRQIIPIVGMGGIGKTSLVRNIYQNQVVVQHFDILAWATISQEYNTKEILSKLLQEGRGDLSQMNEHELGEKLHKRLLGRRYLIIVDDIWDIEAWNQLKVFFPDNRNGSRIMLTTRLSNLASQVADSSGIEMRLLDEDESWSLFSEIVFGEEDCPLELEEIGEKIVENCRGLPLSIIVIGGLLSKSKHTQEYWEYIAENLSSIVNLEDNERCLKILYMSYSQLPVYLRACFLYMGVFSEDRVIRVSKLVKLWVAEGILKPISGKSLEEVANEYLEEIANRNLVSVWSTQSTRYCDIHDLLRDLCLREAQKERFYNVIRQHCLNIPQDTSTQRRIVIPDSTSKDKVLDALHSMSLARTLIFDCGEFLPSPNLRLLRIMSSWSHFDDWSFLENMFHLVNLRYLHINITLGPDSKFPSSVYLLWNLQTIIVESSVIYGSPKLIAPAEIWNMPQLKHVEFEELYLPDPPGCNGRDDIVLGNLQKLKGIINFKCSEEVVKRIPNIKKLEVSYKAEFEEGSPNYCLENLCRLHKLESFSCNANKSGTINLQNLTFPHSLKKLHISKFYSSDNLEKIGSLPLLQKLILWNGYFEGGKWETVEGQFRSLKILRLLAFYDLEYWTAESGSFPRLEHLCLEYFKKLNGIPSEIGEIPTLKSIVLLRCSSSVVISAKKILEEQEEFYGEVSLQVEVVLFNEDKALLSLAGPNFHIVGIDGPRPFILRAVPV